jgi:CHAT domain-containing protein
MLHYLPFHALFDGERYLIERVAVSYAPSAALYGVCQARAKTPRRGRALVLAHSAGGLLPFTAQEAALVGQVLNTPVYQDSAATRSLLESLGSRARLIHIAAHGRFRADAPLFSYIELDDGPLTTADIYSVTLRARLVALSACETGRAVIGGGDELVGLARAFLYAGAAGLLVSQWRVDDEATAELMARFYAELSGGASAAGALQAAQLAAIRRGMRENSRHHPFFWAGFQIIGDSQGLQQRPVRARKDRRA